MITEKIKDQILAVRDSGVANMCDMAAVQRAAFRFNCHEGGIEVCKEHGGYPTADEALETDGD